jgi:hypothetical protein
MKVMRKLEYRIVRDRNDKPLVVLESALGNGQEIHPTKLRALAARLTEIADEADQHSTGKGYMPRVASTEY